MYKGYYLWLVLFGLLLLWSNYSHNTSQAKRITDLEFALSRCEYVLNQ